MAAVTDSWPCSNLCPQTLDWGQSHTLWPDLCSQQERSGLLNLGEQCDGIAEKQKDRITVKQCLFFLSASKYSLIFDFWSLIFDLWSPIPSFFLDFYFQFPRFLPSSFHFTHLILPSSSSSSSSSSIFILFSFKPFLLLFSYPLLFHWILFWL